MSQRQPQAQGDSSSVLEQQVQLPGGRRLDIRLAGPFRPSADTPLVVMIHGLGGSEREWHAVQDHSAIFAPVCQYERAGNPGSEPPASPPTPENIAFDLQHLLNAAELHPPYVLVGHSYGGVIASQLLQDRPEVVAGMVLIDCVPFVRRVPEAFTRLLDDSTYGDITGLNDNLALDAEEYKAILHNSDLSERPGGIAEKELQLMTPANERLRDSLRAQGQILGSRALSVIFCNERNDFLKIYEYGIKKANGSTDDRETLRRHLETMSELDEAAQRAQLGMSSNARFVKTDGKRATHNVHMVEPVWTAEHIRCVFEEASAQH